MKDRMKMAVACALFAALSSCGNRAAPADNSQAAANAQVTPHAAAEAAASGFDCALEGVEAPDRKALADFMLGQTQPEATDRKKISTVMAPIDAAAIACGKDKGWTAAQVKAARVRAVAAISLPALEAALQAKAIRPDQMTALNQRVISNPPPAGSTDRARAAHLQTIAKALGIKATDAQTNRMIGTWLYLKQTENEAAGAFASDLAKPRKGP